MIVAGKTVLELPRNRRLAGPRLDGAGGSSRWRGPGATLAPVRRIARRSRIPALAALLVLGLGLGSTGCKNRDKGGSISELAPPKGEARPWESGLAVAYDDAYTPTAINLQGRAPNDVYDQQLFQARLGYADIVLLVRVQQVWGRGRYEGRQDQFLEVEIGETLLGNLPKDAPENLMLEVDNGDELPGELKGEIMLLFLRWREDREPPFHHHLMPADEDLVALIKSMVKHAQKEGVINAKGDEILEIKRSGRKGRKKKKKKGEEESSTSVPSAGPSGPSSSGSAAGTPVDLGDDGGGPDEPPPPSGPEPDASTGLQDLGGESKPSVDPETDLPPE